MVLIRHQLLDPDRLPSRDEDHVIFPLARVPDEAVQAEIGQPFEVIEGTCSQATRRGPGTLVDLVAGQVPTELLPLVPRSFNITGRACILELENDLLPYRGIIGEAVIALHPAVETVYAKASAREGDFRTRALDLVAGPDDPWTTHVENGNTFKLNIKEVFFDPRLGNEHGRVTTAVATRCADRDCKVLDLFCGAGPFIVPLTRVQGIHAWAVDVNPVAIDLLIQNVEKNKGNVTSVRATCMDAMAFLRDPMPRIDRPRAFDAIFMNLPREAHRFIAPAAPWLGATGSMYWYSISTEIIKGKHDNGRNAAVAVDKAVSHAMDTSNDESHLPPNPVDGILAEGMHFAREARLQVAAVTRVKPYAPYKFIHCIELVRESST